jgi:hypothetical protein
MASAAGSLAKCFVSAKTSLGSHLRDRLRMNAGRPLCKRILSCGDSSSHCRVAGKADLPVGVVANEKLGRLLIDVLDVNVVAGIALDVAVNELDGLG